MSLILSDYRCDEHGDFERIEERPAPASLPCPECGAASERVISGTRPAILTAKVYAATTAKSDRPPPYVMDHSAVADGKQTLGEYHAARDLMYGFGGDE